MSRTTTTTPALVGANLEAAREVARQALFSAVNGLEESAGATPGQDVYHDIELVSRRASLVYRLGTPASHSSEAMLGWGSRQHEDLQLAAGEVLADLTYALEPAAEGAEEREHRMRPTILAAQRVQALLGEEAHR